MAIVYSFYFTDAVHRFIYRRSAHTINLYIIIIILYKFMAHAD